MNTTRETRAEPTKRPWRVENKGDIYGASARAVIVNGQGETVATIKGLSERAYQRAALIVRAVNAHDGLVEALERVVNEHSLRWAPEGRVPRAEVPGSVIEDAREALRQAKGEGA